MRVLTIFGISILLIQEFTESQNAKVVRIHLPKSKYPYLYPPQKHHDHDHHDHHHHGHESSYSPAGVYPGAGYRDDGHRLEEAASGHKVHTSHNHHHTPDAEKLIGQIKEMHGQIKELKSHIKDIRHSEHHNERDESKVKYHKKPSHPQADVQYKKRPDHHHHHHNHDQHHYDNHGGHKVNSHEKPKHGGHKQKKPVYKQPQEDYSHSSVDYHDFNDFSYTHPKENHESYMDDQKRPYHDTHPKKNHENHGDDQKRPYHDTHPKENHENHGDEQMGQYHDSKPEGTEILEEEAPAWNFPWNPEEGIDWPKWI